MSESLGWCVEAVRAAAEPSLSRALLALRGRHTRRAGGPARFRERGGLGPLLELVGPERPRRVLDLALSVLGNCCTEPGCRRQARSLGGVPRLVSVLALAAAPESVLNRASRTLANLALEPDGATDVLQAGAAPLLVSVLSSCSSPGCVLSSARALRLLGTPQLPPQLRLEAVAALAARLAALAAADPSCPALARALRALLAAPCPAALAEAVVPALGVLVALATEVALDARGSALAVLATLSGQGWLRPALGAAGAVEAAVAAFESGVRALCLLCREAVNRARLRRSGGLGALLGVLRDPRARAWHPRALLALATFAWDPLALGKLERAGLVPLLARGLRGAAGGGQGACGDGEGPEEEPEEEEAASADWPREGARRPLPTPSPTSPPLSPPPPPKKPKPPLPPSLETLALPQIPPRFSGDPKVPEAPALLLLERLAETPEPSPSLPSPTLLAALLGYLEGSPRPSPRAPRLLQLLVRNPQFLGLLVRGFVPSLIHCWLVLGVPPPKWARGEGRDPPQTQGGPPEERRERLRELGEQLLRILGATAASPFGVGVLSHALRCGSAPARLASATALLLLARPGSPLWPLLWGGGGALQLLLGGVAKAGGGAGSAPPPFILYAASAIGQVRERLGTPLGQVSPVSRRCPRTSPSPGPSWPQPSPPCPYRRCPHDLWLLPLGRPPAVAACRRALSRQSPVLAAMLGGAFREGRQSLVAIGHCPRAALELLLHFLHGCRDMSCPRFSRPLPPPLAGRALALARRFLVAEFEDLVAAKVSGGVAELWRLAELWGSPALATRVASDVIKGHPLQVATKMAAVAAVATDRAGLAKALLGALSPSPTPLELGGGAVWDPLLAGGGGDSEEEEEGDVTGMDCDVMEEEEEGDVMEGEGWR